MVTEVNSGSHSVIFALSAAVFCVLCVSLNMKPYPRLPVLRNKAENIRTDQTADNIAY